MTPAANASARRKRKRPRREHCSPGGGLASAVALNRDRRRLGPDHNPEREVGRVDHVGTGGLNRTSVGPGMTAAARAMPIHRNDDLGTHRRPPTVDAVAEPEAAVLGV